MTPPAPGADVAVFLSGPASVALLAAYGEDQRGEIVGQQLFGFGRELSARGRVIPVRCGAPLPPEDPGASGGDTSNRFSSRSRPALPAEIPGGFSSSSPPPSF